MKSWTKPRPIQRTKLLSLGVGKPAVEFDDYLKAKHIAYQSMVTEDGHTWMKARHFLAKTLELNFK